MKKYVLLAVVLMIYSVYCQTDLKKAPSFRLENIEGSYVMLDSLVNDGPVIINFWASWCKPCKEELPEFNKISNEFKDKGLKVVLITIDKPSQVQKARNYLKTKGIDLELLKDCSMDTYKSFGGSGTVPYTFLIDKDKNIVFRKKGQINYEELLSEVKKVIK
ncbi:MAG: TlpA disulfide reductase family protein [Candidatus Delongbacteria bacterium]|nr:TlpA disulfide reductase family protein [Candidatus Delongbacteria bacterium]